MILCVLILFVVFVCLFVIVIVSFCLLYCFCFVFIYFFFSFLFSFIFWGEGVLGWFISEMFRFGVGFFMRVLGVGEMIITNTYSIHIHYF